MYTVYDFSIYKPFGNMLEAKKDVEAAFDCQLIQTEWHDYDTFQSSLMGFQINLIPCQRNGDFFTELHGEVITSEVQNFLTDDNIKGVDVSQMIIDIFTLRNSEGWKVMTNELRGQFDYGEDPEDDAMDYEELVS